MNTNNDVSLIFLYDVIEFKNARDNNVINLDCVKQSYPSDNDFRHKRSINGSHFEHGGACFLIGAIFEHFVLPQVRPIYAFSAYQTMRYTYKI